MLLSSLEVPPHLIPLLASAMLVVQMLLVVQRMLITNIRLFALQSALLCAIAFAVGATSGSVHLFLVGSLTFALKVCVLPWFLVRLVRRIGIEQEVKPLINPPSAMLLCGGFTLLGYIVARPFSSLEKVGNKTLGVAVTLLLTGFFLMLNRRKAVTQVLALLTAENGLFLAAIALTSYGMPLVVELGILFDVMVAVMVLGILVYRIRETFASMDVSKLSNLKG
jgi:hydrogenase-4 component E